MTLTELRALHTAGVITGPELEILEFRERGFTQFQISHGLGISRSAVRDRERNAHRKIALHKDTT